MAESLDAFFAKHDLAVLGRAAGWKVERSPDSELVFVTLQARDGEIYRVMCVCDGYSALAPSVKFVAANNSPTDPKAWPHGNGAFLDEVKPPPNSFLCMPLTREGLQHHGDWKNSPAADAWNGDRHTLLDIFNRLKRMLNGPNYIKRGGSQ